jgi:hypothetical protein
MKYALEMENMFHKFINWFTQEHDCQTAFIVSMLRYLWQVSNVFHGPPPHTHTPPPPPPPPPPPFPPKRTFALELKHTGKSNSMKSDTIWNTDEIIFK